MVRQFRWLYRLEVWSVFWLRDFLVLAASRIVDDAKVFSDAIHLGSSFRSARRQNQFPTISQELFYFNLFFMQIQNRSIRAFFSIDNPKSLIVSKNSALHDEYIMRSFTGHL